MGTNTVVHVSFDLGYDTLKIAYAYNRAGREHTGKIVADGTSFMAVPGVAYFSGGDGLDGKWYFADEVERQNADSYLTVVKIKRLILLLQPVKDRSEITKSNARYYNHNDQFPKFAFPEPEEGDDDFSGLVERRRTFEAFGFTPRSVCEDYFRHVGKMVEKRIKELLGEGCELRLSIVYQPNVGEKVTEELKRLVSLAFGDKYKITTVLSMTKALSIYAKQRGFIKDGQSALVFNVGEDKTFVVKTNIERGGVSIDGVEGHNSPVDLGGNDIDRSVADYLEGKIENRETMGSPSVGSGRHVFERGLLTKQYLFLQEIKISKIFFGMYGQNDKPFSDGVPVHIIRDTEIRVKLTHAEFAKCVGIEGDKIITGSFADRLYKYITKELEKNINRGVNKIFLTGGVVETYRLVEVLKKKLQKAYPKIETGTFESADAKKFDGSDGYEVYSHEDAVYAPAVGCALASLGEIKAETLTSLTYGTDVYVQPQNSTATHCLMVPLLFKGEQIGENGRKAYDSFVVRVTDSASLLIFSTTLSKGDIALRAFEEKGLKYERNNLFVFASGKEDKAYRDKLSEYADFCIRNAGHNEVTFYYNGSRVRFDAISGGDGNVHFFAGVKIDKNGVAGPYVENDRAKNAGAKVRISFINSAQTSTTVPATDIEFRAADFSVKIEGAD